ncbi:membrane protein insertase YidC [Telmatospirillum siberiense]|uniref:Membrane protein insertase YidC n=1 Tax=Telmatospirillum siberiense TaxID=382514 RepID=A0A2N3Q0N3_9PROT|nr:membrane protein insertase YidC [Telmatospirillum siberiense]PKU26215.1 membrane protein insertase YidC [Telmatospirillum siberiense]
MNEQKNIILAIALSVAILLGWQFLMPKPATPPGQTPSGQTDTQAGPDKQTSAVPKVPDQQTSAVVPAVVSAETRAAAIAQAPRVKISTPSLSGSFSLMGGRIDDLDLVHFHESPDPASPEITLLSPGAGAGAYYAEFGFVAADAKDKDAIPGPDTLWTASGQTLTPDTPVTLTWENGHGLKFSRTYTVDANYMFSVTQKVENTGSSPITLFPYALVSRWGTPKTQDIYILHEGALGVLDGTLKEMKYKKLREDEHLVEAKSTGGWIGFTDKYWLTALIPDQSMPISTRMNWRAVDGVDRYQSDWLGGGLTVAAGASSETTSHFFAGAKELAKLDAYGEKLGIPRFDLAIDFGWFYFLTKPFFYFLRFIHSEVANFGIAILIFTVIIKGAFFPIANKSYKAMSKMKKLQPEVKKLQERFGDDRARLNQEMMALYKREKANPVSGCLPILIQIPVFFALYKVLYVTIEMRQAPFFGWIKDLSVPDPTTIFNLFGLIPWVPPEFLHIGIWPLIMGVTMYLQQKLNPAPADPIQAKMFTFLPIIFTFMLASFPAGLVIYWAWSNTLSIAQQWLIMRRQDRT